MCIGVLDPVFRCADKLNDYGEGRRDSAAEQSWRGRKLKKNLHEEKVCHRELTRDTLRNTVRKIESRVGRRSDARVKEINEILILKNSLHRARMELGDCNIFQFACVQYLRGA